MDTVKNDKIIPVNEKKVKFAYQTENIRPVLYLSASIPNKGGNEEYPNKEAEVLRCYHSYELQIYQHTYNFLTIELRKFYKNGAVECYSTGMSFSTLINQIFAGIECSKYEEREGKLIQWIQTSGEQIWIGKYDNKDYFKVEVDQEKKQVIIVNRFKDGEQTMMPSISLAMHYCETELLPAHLGKHVPEIPIRWGGEGYTK